MKHSILGIVPIFLLAILLTACTTPSKLAFLQDMAYNTAYPAQAAPELIVHKGDMLEIQVFSESPELAAPFRLTGGSTAESGKAADRYMVDGTGEIVFPVVGHIKVEGKTLRGVQETIGELISEKGFIKNPSVRVHISNFNVTVVGNAGNVVIPVEDGCINILQVIARSGGVKGGGNNIKEVTVIRTEEGIRTAYKVNLQEKALFDSPVYYLQQGDIVYVKPKGRQLSSAGQASMPFITAALSLASIISNLLLWSSR